MLAAFGGSLRGCHQPIVWQGSPIGRIHMAAMSSALCGMTPQRSWPYGGQIRPPSTHSSGASEDHPHVPAKITTTTAKQTMKQMPD